MLTAKPGTLRRKLLVAVAIAACFFVLATLTIVVFGLNDDIRRADVGLVFGSKVERDGTPSPRLRARLDRTIEHFRDGWFASVVASGGFGKEGYDEAVVMRDYLVSHGVPAERVILDSRGDTTFASARNAARIARERNFKSVFSVSQYFHIARSRLALARSGLPLAGAAHANLFELRDVYSAVRGTAGCASYLLRRWD